MTTCEPKSITTASERTFAHLWGLSGGGALVGYEAMLLTTLARADLPLYRHLTARRSRRSDAFIDAVEAIQDWRRAVAARHPLLRLRAANTELRRTASLSTVTAGDPGVIKVAPG